MTLATSDNADEVMASANGNVNVKADASLVYNGQGEEPGSTGALTVEIGWVGGDSMSGLNRGIEMEITFGNAWIYILGGDGSYMIAEGYDGYANYFATASTSATNSLAGSFGIGPNDFTAPLQANSQTHIHRMYPNQTSPAYTVVNGGSIVGGWGQSQDGGTDIYSGVIAISAY
jgi:hypothetical protein